MKKKILNQKQRLLAAVLYVIVIVLIYWILGDGISGLLQQREPESVWFFSGILLVILGKYVSEPYFSSPSDTFTNSLSLIIFLLGLAEGKQLKGYWILLVCAAVLFALSLSHMLFKDKSEKFRKLSYSVLRVIGKSEVIFSAVYILSAFSYFNQNYPMLLASLLLWVMMVPVDSLSYIISWICSCINIIKEKESGSIGIAVRNSENEYYTIQVSKTDKHENLLNSISDQIFVIKTDSDSYSIGIATGKTNLIESIWIDLFLLESKFNYDFNTVKTWNITPEKAELIGTTYISSIAELPANVQLDISSSHIWGKRDKLIGFILQDSNLNSIKFKLCDSKGRIKEGVIVKTNILGEPVLYQVINGITRIESNRADNEAGYMCAVGRKLGKYNQDKNELQSVNWTPKMSEPVYLCEVNNDADLEEISKTAIGRLPGSDMKIPLKDINALVTHNTAVLGILGVGKSCLTFELIKKIVDEGKKVICIDITNQYSSEDGLLGYLDENDIVKELSDQYLTDIANQANKTGDKNNADEWGNLKFYKDKIQIAINYFMNRNDKKVLILNPDKHIVAKASNTWNITNCVDVSLVEKVQIISECILAKCMELGQIAEARCCVVYEEAHSLTPEFNSIVVKDDSNHANGTAKVILQGRKYGLGCIIVTQRTANVTKSILNQCNTIFALRVFDDTGKSFLENYIGKDYSDVLPTLEERHAVVIGKGIGLKQPVIIQLNDAKYLRK